MIKGLHHNAYRCRDSEETRKFYEDFLGLPLVNAFKIEETMTGRKTGAGVLHSFFQLDDGSCLAFFEAPDMPFEFKDQHDFDLHIALEVEPEALEAMFAKGKAEGREVRGISDHKFIRSIYFRDPNGYVIELTAKVPGHESAMDPTKNQRPRHPERLAGEEAPTGRPAEPAKWRNDQETTEENDEARCGWRRLVRPVGACRVARRPPSRPDRAAVPGRSVLAQAAAQQLALRPGRRASRSTRTTMSGCCSARARSPTTRRAPRSSRRATSAAPPRPSVMEFDADGNLSSRAGAVPDTKPWVANEHGIYVDHKGFVWIAGNGDKDSAIFKFTKRRQARADDRQARPDRRQQRHDAARPAGRHRGRPEPTSLRRRRLRQPPRHRVRRRHRRLQAALGRLRQASRRRQAAGLRSRPRRSRSSSATRCTARSLERRPRLCLRPHQQPHPGVQEGRHLRHRVVLRQVDARRRLGLGPQLLARRQPDLPVQHRRREQPAAHPAAQRRPGGRRLRPLRPLRRPLPLGPQHRRQLQGQHLHGRSRQRERVQKFKPTVPPEVVTTCWDCISKGGVSATCVPTEPSETQWTYSRRPLHGQASSARFRRTRRRRSQPSRRR